MILREMKYSLSDVVMIPAVQSVIDSRSQCCPFDANGMLPLITAPMYSVVDSKNAFMFINNGIYAIYPRGCDGKAIQNSFMAYSLDGFISKFLDNEAEGINYALVDIANGHMIKLSETVSKAKNKYGENLILMVGNIANPETLVYLAECGADYVRLGIGAGQACTTAANSSIHFPMASLISECRDMKERNRLSVKLIADGGMRNFDDIIKALGLGADYVMCGSVFNKMLESAGKTCVEIKGFDMPDLGSQVDQYSPETKKSMEFKTVTYMKEYYGMSTKRAQREMGITDVKTSEGITKYQHVEYTMEQWVENFKHYLTTAMSYTGKKTLDSFIGNVDFNLITPAAMDAYRK